MRVATHTVWALPRSLATTGGIVVTFFSCGYLEVSVPRVRLPHRGMTESLPPGCPIRTSADLWVFAPPRGFSQLVTSFFASESQGIPHPPFFHSVMSLSVHNAAEPVGPARGYDLCFCLQPPVELPLGLALYGRPSVFCLLLLVSRVSTSCPPR